jgi:hypothetical protein
VASQILDGITNAKKIPWFAFKAKAGSKNRHQQRAVSRLEIFKHQISL